MFQLLLITSLGVVVNLGTYPSAAECLKASAFTQPSQGASISCVPVQSPAEIKKQVDQTLSMMIDSINKVQTQLK